MTVTPAQLEMTEHTFTVYKIETDLLNVTHGGSLHPEYLPGYIRVASISDGHRHEFVTDDPKSWHVGDTYKAMIETETR
jgi:hypothetical protein